MTLPQRRCPSCDGKHVAEHRIYTLQGGAPRTRDHGACCERALSAPSPPPRAHVQTPRALVGQVLAALTDGGGINAATRLYGGSKHRSYRWPERRSGGNKRCGCLPCPRRGYPSALQALSWTRASRSLSLPTRHTAGPWCGWIGRHVFWGTGHGGAKTARC